MQSTLVLSRSDGSIIQKLGLLAETFGQTESPSNTSIADGDPDNRTKDASAGVDEKTAESIAHRVFSFMTQAQEFAEGMDATDEVRLLRLRTRKNEIVIVPGQ